MFCWNKASHILSNLIWVSYTVPQQGRRFKFILMTMMMIIIIIMTVMMMVMMMMNRGSGGPRSRWKCTKTGTGIEQGKNKWMEWDFHAKRWWTMQAYLKTNMVFTAKAGWEKASRTSVHSSRKIKNCKYKDSKVDSFLKRFDTWSLWTNCR